MDATQITLTHTDYPTTLTVRYLDEENRRIDWSNGQSMVVDIETARRCIAAHKADGWTLGAAA